MRKSLAILLFSLIGYASLAQKQEVSNLTTFDDKRLHFGFTLALNTLDFRVEHAGTGNMTDVAKLSPGFSVGMVSNLRLLQDLDLRFLPGMSFGSRDLVYNIPVTGNSGDAEYYSVNSIFLDFPLLLKYKARRMNNQRPYLIGGLAYRVDISKTGSDDLVRLKPLDTYLEVGLGWDSYLEWFRLSTELKFSFGLLNIRDSGPKLESPLYTEAISGLTSNIFTLSFHFE